MEHKPTFIELYSRNVDKISDYVIAEDKYGKYTLDRLESYSNRIHAYLKEREIGKDSKVMILLPRGFSTLATILGIIKSGAVFIPLEEAYPDERLMHIKIDCDPDLIVDAETYSSMINYDELPGFDDTDDHDLCFIIYTSGSTGNPKGVMHEYGDLDHAIEVYYDMAKETNPELSTEEYFDSIRDTCRPLVSSPCYFIAGLAYYLYSLYAGNYHYYISPEDFNDINTFKSLLNDKQISEVFLTPSYLNVFNDIKTPYLQNIYTGAEICSNLLTEGVTFMNCYGMSESVNTIAYFVVDRIYENTPIGKPQKFVQVHLIGDNGKEVKKGEMGELIFYNPYFRGYYNLPEQTAKVKKGNWYYTGDMAKELPDGNLVILGRKDDMIKINGNRVEPGEVASAFKELLGLSWTHAQAFSIRGKNFLCAYYVDDIDIDINLVKEGLSNNLPSYMIPSYFIKVDEIPKLASGKVDRLAFSAPEIDHFKAEYVEPVTETEKMFCSLLEKILEIDPIGTADDFTVLGGDSLVAMQLVAECNLPGFEIGHILRYKTIANIAKRYDEIKARNSKSLDQRNKENLKKNWPLLPHQQMFLSQQKEHPESMEYNLSLLIKFDKEIVARKFKNAVDTVIENHPAFFTVISRDGQGNYYQKYDKSVEQKLKVESVSDEEMLVIKDTLSKPFDMIESRLYECRLFASSSYFYLFLDVHHILSDGTSLDIFIKDLLKAMDGEKLESDYYYVSLEDYSDALEYENMDEFREYYEETYKDFSIPSVYKEEFCEDGKELSIPALVNVSKNKLKKSLKNLNITASELYMGAMGLAIANVTKEARFGFGWTYNGRDSIIKNNSFACYINQLMAYIDIDKTPNLASYFENLKDQIKGNLANMLYPYAFTILPQYQGAVSYIYQGGILDAGEDSRFEMIPVNNEKNASDSFMQFNVYEGSSGLSIVCDFNTAFFDEEVIKKIMFNFGTVLRKIVNAKSPKRNYIRGIIWNIEETEKADEQTLDEAADAQNDVIAASVDSFEVDAEDDELEGQITFLNESR